MRTDFAIVNDGNGMIQQMEIYQYSSMSSRPKLISSRKIYQYYIDF